MKILAAFSAALVVCLLAAAQAPARGGDFVDCGDQKPAPQGAPYTDLKAEGVSCKAAHKIATKFVKDPFTEGPRGWSCTSRQVGAEELRVKCARVNNGGQRLKFFWGA